jgi:hypothetical protein
MQSEDNDSIVKYNLNSSYLRGTKSVGPQNTAFPIFKLKLTKGINKKASPSIIRIIKLRRMRWAGHAA